MPDFFWQETENAHAPSEGLRRFDGPRNKFGREFVYLGDAILEPVSEELERCKTVV
jgi:hypothetical protein